MNKTLIGIALFSLATPYAVGWQQNFLHACTVKW